MIYIYTISRVVRARTRAYHMRVRVRARASGGDAVSVPTAGAGHQRRAPCSGALTVVRAPPEHAYLVLPPVARDTVDAVNSMLVRRTNMLLCTVLLATVRTLAPLAPRTPGPARVACLSQCADRCFAQCRPSLASQRPPRLSAQALSALLRQARSLGRPLRAPPSMDP